MNQQVIINVGVSGAGKTSWSTEYIKSHTNTLRINRDDIRKMLVGNLEGYYKRRDLREVEDKISSFAGVMLMTLVSNGFNVIVDNTHLKKEYIEQVVSLVKAVSANPVDIKFKLFEIDSKYILKDRVSKRDSVLESELDYIDKQIKQLEPACRYVRKEYPNQILN